MQSSHTPGSNYSGKEARIAIVSARFNGEIVSSMHEAALTALLENGVEKKHIDTKYVPGAFELPIVCQSLAESKKYHGIIALGCVIRGETPHFDYVCQGCTSGIQDVMLQTGIPIAFGVLTTNTIEQALARSSNEDVERNKGRYSALCVLEMINELKSINS